MAKFKGAVVVDRERCKGCGLCVAACPSKVLGLASQVNAKGYNYASLLASQDKPSLVAYYVKLGFRKEETITFFGHNYWRMRLQLK